jgi:hypothetical protein
MRIYEVTDGPNMGGQMFQAMDTPTQKLLHDIATWKQEIKKAKLKASAEKYRTKLPTRNDVIQVGTYKIPVVELEQWIDTGDDAVMYDTALKNRTAVVGGPTKDPELIRQNEHWKNLVKNIWQEAAARMYPSLRSKYPALLVTHLATSLNILWRPYRIQHHIDLKGRRYSPHIEHPELVLPKDHAYLHVVYK